MDKREKIETYYAKDQKFKEGIALLREIALKTELEETLKWGAPIYTIENKNVLGILAFKSHFGIWFYNGVFLLDPKKVLSNAQEGKTKAMRHWKFTAVEEIEEKVVLAYMNEAITNQKKGIALLPEKKKKTAIPVLLQHALENNPEAMDTFKALSPYKQGEYSEYVASAKQEKTKLSRLAKILPMISEGKGLHDKYR